MIRKIASIVLVLTLAWLAPPAEGTQKGRLGQLMQDKLRHAQTLFQGIALADFAKIQSSAQDLLELSKTAEWLAYRTPRYELHSNAFQQAAEEIIRKAKAKNIDGVVLAYQDLTMSCVRCHQYLREVRDARGPAEEPFDVTRRED